MSKSKVEEQKGPIQAKQESYRTMNYTAKVLEANQQHEMKKDFMHCDKKTFVPKQK